MAQTAMTVSQIIRDEHAILGGPIWSDRVNYTSEQGYSQYPTSCRSVHMAKDRGAHQRGYANGDQLLNRVLMAVGSVVTSYIPSLSRQSSWYT
jgi:hypothetical protein